MTVKLYLRGVRRPIFVEGVAFSNVKNKVGKVDAAPVACTINGNDAVIAAGDIVSAVSVPDNVVAIEGEDAAGAEDSLPAPFTA